MSITGVNKTVEKEIINIAIQNQIEKIVLFGSRGAFRNNQKMYSIQCL